MDELLSAPLRQWKLETRFHPNGDRHHQSSSGLEGWRPVRQLGSGVFSTVWQEQCFSGSSKGNTVRAVKYIRKQQPNFEKMCQREIGALVTFSDPSVPEYQKYFVQFFGWFDDAEYLYIAMEFIPHGTVQQYIEQGPLPEPDAALITRQVARAVQYIHQKKFVHRDIKPANLLVQNPGPNWHIKVADFGISKNTEATAMDTFPAGSPRFMAPEILGDSSGSYTAAVDVWSLGATVYNMRTGSPPFHNFLTLFQYTLDHRKFPVRALGSSSGFCMDFVLGAMAEIPERRLTIDQVLAHDWLSMSSNATIPSPESHVRQRTRASIWNPEMASLRQSERSSSISKSRL